MATNDKGLTPMMRQFFSMKEKHPEAFDTQYYTAETGTNVYDYLQEA